LQEDAHELLNQGDNNGATPIHHLCKNAFFPDKLSPYINNPSIMINKADNSGKTALHYAAFHHRYRLIDKLLLEDKDTSCDLIDNDGNTALHSAFQNRNNEAMYDAMISNTVISLVHHGDINLILRKNYINQTALDIAELMEKQIMGNESRWNELFDWQHGISTLIEYEIEYRNKIYDFFMNSNKE
jgi:ankyrin repeat protein